MKVVGLRSLMSLWKSIFKQPCVKVVGGGGGGLGVTFKEVSMGW